MSHSPLKMFHQFQNKHVLVSGQGPIEDIARGLGFTNVTTVDKIRQIFSNLDMVDHKRRKSAVSTCKHKMFRYVTSLNRTNVIYEIHNVVA